MIVNADDFGVSRSTNEAVYQAIIAGRVNSVSLMVTMPYFNAAVKFLKKHPHVSVGLHFNLTEGVSYQGLIPLLISLLIGKITLSNIEHELKSQYTKLKNTGLTISHLDSHEHIHLFPTIFRVFRDFAHQTHIPRIRCSSFRGINAGSFKGIFIQFLYGFDHWLFMKKDGIPTLTDTFFDLNWRRLPASLPTFSKNTEIACHLSAKPAGNRFSRDRYACYLFLMGPAFGKIIT